MSVYFRAHIESYDGYEFRMSLFADGAQSGKYNRRQIEMTQKVLDILEHTEIDVMELANLTQEVWIAFDKWSAAPPFSILLSKLGELYGRRPCFSCVALKKQKCRRMIESYQKAHRFGG